MAAHFQSVLGRDLARILYADGWRPQKPRHNQVVLWKGDKHISLIPSLHVSLKRVRAICATAKISAQQFDELFRTAPQVDCTEGAPPLPPTLVIPANPTKPH